MVVMVPERDCATTGDMRVIGPRYREDLYLDAPEALEQVFGVVTPIDPKKP
jgi:hypothetical protein